MCLFAVNDQNSGADLVAVLQDRLVHKGQASDGVPTLIGVEGALVIGSALVILAVILDEERQILGHGQFDATAAAGIFALLILGGSQVVQSGLFLIALCFTVLRVKITVGVDAGHVVHGGNDRRLDAGIERRDIQRHTAPSANADDTDAVGIDPIVAGQVIDRRLKILGVDIR